MIGDRDGSESERGGRGDAKSKPARMPPADEEEAAAQAHHHCGGADCWSLAGGGGGAYFLLSGKKEQAHDAKAPGAVKPVAFLDLPDVLVNLSSSGGDRAAIPQDEDRRSRLPDQTLIAQIQPVMPRVMDAFQTYLRELRPTDLDGSAGLYRLKEELTRRVNAAIAPSRINAVLFKEIVVQ